MGSNNWWDIIETVLLDLWGMLYSFITEYLGL